MIIFYMETLKMNINNKEQEVILPVERMVGTVCYGSDRYVVVCTSVASNKKCSLVVIYEINEDNYNDYIEKGKDGLEYLELDAYNELVRECDTKEYSLRKNGLWFEKGDPIYMGCGNVSFGYARPYLDPSF